jgi:hypothetical protein
MTEKPKRSRDINQLAKFNVDHPTMGEDEIKEFQSLLKKRSESRKGWL